MKRSLLTCSLVLFATLPAARADEPAALARQVRDMLAAHCQGCHGRDGTAKGGFDYVVQLDRLVARGKVVPGRAAESELFQRIRDGDMPPRTHKARPGKDELATLERWITAGAPGDRQTTPRRLVSEGDIVQAIRADLEAQPERRRRFLRYFSLASVANAGRPDDELESLRLGLAKLVNALSWHPRISRPLAVDETALLYRIDLRDYKWTARQWEHIVSSYPYRLLNASPTAKENAALAGAEQPYLRADWFIATAARAPLYYDLLQMPATDRGLERLLQVDAAADIQDDNVVRAGFNGSGVSKNNRLLERHDAAFGAYWRTCDFSENTARQNLFEHPLGPPPGVSSFVPAGGEAIFHLPNGLHAYLLMDGAGRRLDRGPIEIVSDPQRPDRAVEAGLSCMSCHARGYIHRADQVRGHVLKNANAFTREQVDTVKAVYPKEARFRVRIDQDNERYLKALAQTGVRVEEPEPVTAVTLRYEAVVDLAGAAADAGLSEDEFRSRLNQSAALNRVLGPLQVKGGTVQRQTFQSVFPDLVREFRLGDAPSIAAPVVRPFRGHTAAITALAVSPDGKRVLSGSEDRTLRLWDVDSGKELRRLAGHASTVAAVAFAPDGCRIVSGSHDRTLRLWDAETGTELRRFDGHTDKVLCVAFAPLGNQIVSGSQDGTLRLWDVEKGTELRIFTGHTGWVRSVAFAPSGALLVSGGHDRTVRLWDVERGTEVRRLEGPTREVYAVAFAADGNLIAAGGNDRTVYLWDAKSGQEVRRLEGHGNAVIAVAFAGNHVLSGSSQYRKADRFLRRWRLADGKEADNCGGEAERVGCVAFARDGKRSLTDGPDFTLRLWKLDSSRSR